MWAEQTVGGLIAAVALDSWNLRPEVLAFSIAQQMETGGDSGHWLGTNGRSHLLDLGRLAASRRISQTMAVPLSQTFPHAAWSSL